MRKEEKKMRKLLKDAWTDFKESSITNKRHFCSVYLHYLHVAEEIFPQINIERLEERWANEWKRNND